MTSLAGSFLIARPLLKDPSFRQTVVLLLQHSQEGAFGVIVNRPADVDGVPFPVFAGGPCESQGVVMLHGHADWDEANKHQVAPGIFTGDASCLKQATESASERFRVFAGYAGWGPDQLERELASGAWAVASASGDVLFETPAAELWERLVPPSLPEPSLN